MLTKADKNISDAEVAHVFQKQPTIPQVDIKPQKFTDKKLEQIKICTRCNLVANEAISSHFMKVDYGQFNNGVDANQCGGWGNTQVHVNQPPPPPQYHPQNSCPDNTNQYQPQHQQIPPPLYPGPNHNSIMQPINHHQATLPRSLSHTGVIPHPNVNSLNSSSPSQKADLDLCVKAMENHKNNQTNRKKELSNRKRGNGNNDHHNGIVKSSANGPGRIQRKTQGNSNSWPFEDETKPEIALANDIFLRSNFQNLGEYIKNICTHGTLADLKLVHNKLEKEHCLWVDKTVLRNLLTSKGHGGLAQSLLEKRASPARPGVVALGVNGCHFRPVSETTSPSSSNTSMSSFSGSPHNPGQTGPPSNNSVGVAYNSSSLATLIPCLCNTQSIHSDFTKDYQPWSCQKLSLVNLVLDESHQTTLTWSVFHGRADMVEFLLELSSVECKFLVGQLNPQTGNPCIPNPLNLTTINKECALSFASARGFLEIVKLLLEKKANPNPEIDENGGTPLLYAIQKAFPSIVELLIKSGAKITNCGDYDAYPLAIELKHFLCAEKIENCVIDILEKSQL